MSVFSNLESFLAFPYFDASTDLVSILKKINNELKDQKRLLNKYFKEILKISTNIDIDLATSLADEICSKVLDSCYKIFYNDSGKEKNKYFSLVENYINQHPSDVKNTHTRAEYYATKILMTHLEVFADDFIKLVKEKFKCISFNKLNSYYDELAKIVTQDRMEYLNDFLCEAFFMCPIGVAFVGKIAVNCMGMLSLKDRNTSKHVFEIILDEL